MRLTAELAAVGRLELSEVLRSRWLVFCVVIYALLSAAFVLVGIRDSTMLGFAGMGRVLLSLSHALVLILPLLALTATGQVINKAREDGTLELLFSQPIRRSAFFGAVTLVRAGLLILPLLILMALMAIVGSAAFDQSIPWDYLLRALAVSVSLLLCFIGVGLAVSTYVRSQARAMIWILLLWAAGVALLDFALVGAMLQWQLNPQSVFILAAVNPVQSARLALLSSATPELSSLGPVGFYMANRLGPAVLFAVGTLWPLVVGGVAWLFALGSFRRGDIV